MGQIFKTNNRFIFTLEYNILFKKIKKMLKISRIS